MPVADAQLAADRLSVLLTSQNDELTMDVTCDTVCLTAFDCVAMSTVSGGQHV